MKLFLLFFFILFVSSSIFSQAKSKETYIIIQIIEERDHAFERPYYFIIEETGNPLATEIKSLTPYNEDGLPVSTSFVSDHGDSAKIRYNYFLTKYDALQFLADHDWQLISVYTEIYSHNGYAGINDLLVSEVHSRPVYYFKKKI